MGEFLKECFMTVNLPVTVMLLTVLGYWLMVIVGVLGLDALDLDFGADRQEASLLMACGFVARGGAEWVREDLRKPYVIDRFMLVNGVRLPAPAGAPARRGPSTKLGSGGL